MDVNRIFAELVRESEEMITGMGDWRRVHPHAGVAEIEAAVDE